MTALCIVGIFFPVCVCVCPELELTESVAQSREMQRRGGGGGDSLLLTPSVLIMDFFLGHLTCSLSRRESTCQFHDGF